MLNFRITCLSLLLTSLFTLTLGHAASSYAQEAWSEEGSDGDVMISESGQNYFRVRVYDYLEPARGRTNDEFRDVRYYANVEMESTVIGFQSFVKWTTRFEDHAGRLVEQVEEQWGACPIGFYFVMVKEGVFCCPTGSTYSRASQMCMLD